MLRPFSAHSQPKPAVSSRVQPRRWRKTGRRRAGVPQRGDSNRDAYEVPAAELHGNLGLAGCAKRCWEGQTPGEPLALQASSATARWRVIARLEPSLQKSSGTSTSGSICTTVIRIRDARHHKIRENRPAGSPTAVLIGWRRCDQRRSPVGPGSDKQGLRPRRPAQASQTACERAGIE